MPIIPLHDTCVVTLSSGLDDWGQPIAGASTTYKCRIDEGTKLTRNAQGAEVATTTQILLNKAVAVGYDDSVTWTDAGGVQRMAKPIRISTLKDIGSKPMFTKVEL